MNKIIIIGLVFIVFLCGMKQEKQVSSEGIVFLHPVTDQVQIDSFHYANSLIDPKRKLYIDLYQPELDSHDLRPVVLFIHGGGFSSGSRNHPFVKDFCLDFASRGYVVASIDYSLFMKGKSFHCDQQSKEKVKAFEYAVADIRRSVSFLKSMDSSYKLDMEQVIITGSSAGAEALLHAVFWPEKGMNSFGFMAPKDFNFAGCISFAGAMIDTLLIKRDNAIPAMLFHGSCDPLVPYKTDYHHYCASDTPGALKLHGSSSIADRYQALNKSHVLYTFCGKGHEVANLPMKSYRQEIASFIYNTVLNHKPVNRHVIEKGGDKNCNYGSQKICRD